MAAPAHAPALAPGPSSLLRGLRAVRRHLPEGGGLPDDARRRRHQGILTLLWLHVPGIFLFGLVQRADVGHLLLEVLPIAAAAATAGQLSHRRVLSTVVASTGLVTASGVIVHLSGGVIEAHFHFFVMVGVVVLYQEWWPFLVAIGYVVLHHGTLGTMASHSVYNHDAAINNPWKWAVVHGAFILGMSAAGIVTWRLNESLRKAAVASEHHLAEAQQLARLGSWELDVRTQELAASDELNRMFGFSPVESPAVERFVERVHPEDRAQLTRWVNEASRTRTPMAIDFRVVKDGEVRSFHARGQTVVDETGAITKLRGTTQDITERKVIEEALSRESMVRRLLQTVAVAANEARTVPAAMQVAVEQVCKFTGWPVGHAFLSCGPGELLVSAGVWHLSEPDRFEGFRRATERTALPVGSGFAGRVSFTGVPAWITDLSKE